jgi:hypothetical protein
MTREFNSQRRDDSRPSFRRTHPYDNGTTRSPRPGRPRLNRETVDRAWETGAQHHHADYALRDGRGPANRQNHYARQQRQEPERNTFQRERVRKNGNGGSENYRADHRDYRNAPYHPQPNRHNGAEPRYHQRHDDRHGPDSFDERSHPHSRRQRDFRSSRDIDTPYRERQQQGYQEHDSHIGRNNYQERAPRHYDRFEAPTEQPQRSNGRDTRSDFNREHPFSREKGGRRFQERRPEQMKRYGQAHHYDSPEIDNAMFEGDYERFTANTQEPVRRVRHIDTHKRAQNRHANSGPEQHHMAPLSNRHVLKGPRSQQRKQAQFWTEVSEESDELLSNIHTQEAEQEYTNEGSSTEGEKAHRPRSQAASAVTRKHKSSANGNSGTILRPSQRGFKWPTP